MAGRGERKIRLMADYNCFPLWDIGETGPMNLDPGELPLSEGLVGDLMEWARMYDQTLDRSDPLNSDFANDGDSTRFADEGRRLAQRLARELGSSWSIYYFDQETGVTSKVNPSSH